MKKNILRKISAGMVALILMLACFYAGTDVEQRLEKYLIRKQKKCSCKLRRRCVRQNGETNRIQYSSC